MVRRGDAWEVQLPVVDVDLPFVYFVVMDAPGTTQAEEAARGIRQDSAAEQRNPVRQDFSDRIEESSGAEAVSAGEVEQICSPIRVCWPRRLGMEEPTRSFFPFLEGFEDQVWGWHVSDESREENGLSSVESSHTGRRALAVRIPNDRSSISILTTRVRGWQAMRQGALGIRLWLQSPDGPARARFILMSHSGTTNEITEAHQRIVHVDSAWQDVNLSFSDFAGVPLVSVDALAIEVIGAPSQTVLLDDLQLLGPWRLID